MKRIFIWLDDEREISSIWRKVLEKEKNFEYKIFRTAEDLIKWYNENLGRYDRIFISFDHDLGSGYTGYDMAKYIVEYNLQLDGFTVHSMNPVGSKNIIEILNRYNYYKMKYTSDILK